MRTAWLLSLLSLPLPFGCYGHSRSAGSSAKAAAAGGARLVAIPSGTFTMGDVNGEPSEYPERSVRLDGFHIEATEVSNADYGACVSAGACDPTPYAEDPVLGVPEHPVVGVSWLDARRYCRWRGRRLPTEAEWERAARGSDLRKWPWGPGFDPARANTRDPSDGFEKTAPVGHFSGGRSPYGVFDMAGNVAEWTADVFDPSLYRREPRATNPTGPTQGRERVVRGGSWGDGPHRVRVASRRAKSATEVDDGTGFRCARTEN